MAENSANFCLCVLIFIGCSFTTLNITDARFLTKNEEIPNYTYQARDFGTLSLADRLKRQIWAGWFPMEVMAPNDISASTDYSLVLDLLEEDGPGRTWHPPSLCGERPDDQNSIRRSRIVAGINAASRWPWQVQLYNVSSGKSACGGTLISEEYVVTAAHCLTSLNYHNELIVRVGDLDTSRSEGYEQDFEMECVHIHKGYTAANQQSPILGNVDLYANDIALIKLRTSPENHITISSAVMPACLPEKNEFRPGAECYVTGWGYTGFVDFLYDIQPDVLHEARIPLIRNSKCKKIDVYRAKLNPKKLCAGYLSGPRRPDTCKKDSGGPLVCKGTNNKWKLWGVTSEGENTFCEENPTTAMPGIYTRVDKYLYWLKQKMTSSKCPQVPLVQSETSVIFPPRQVRSPS